MVPTSLDPRATRSRAALQHSLKTLLLRQAYAQISIQQLLEHAQVSRSTFYAHFADKAALLYSLEVALPTQLELALSEETPLRLLSVLFEHAQTAYTVRQPDLWTIMRPSLEQWVGRYIEVCERRAWRPLTQLELWKPVAVASVGILLEQWLVLGGQDRDRVVAEASTLVIYFLERAQ